MVRKILDPVRDVQIRELIGSRFRVIDHTDPGFKGLTGTLIDETMGTFLLRIGEEKRRMPKKGAVIEIFVDEEDEGTWVRLKGDELLHRPEDRTKKLERKRIDRPRTPEVGIEQNSR